MKKKSIVLFIVLAVVIALAVTLAACDGTEAIYAPMMTNEYTEMPTGKDITPEPWSESDSYTLEMNEDGNVYCTDNSYIVCIEKEPDRDFVILNFSDIQLSTLEWEWSATYVEIAKETIAKLIEAHNPDLITLTGDQCYGEIVAFTSICEYLDSFDIPWAPVFGNHDNESDELTVATQAIRMATCYKNCLLKVGPSNLANIGSSGEIAYGNYIVNVVEKSQNDFAVVKSIILFNSGDNADYSDEKYDNEQPVTGGNFAQLSENQVAWYKWAVSGVQKYGYNGKVSSMIVTHIPIYAYAEAFGEALATDISVYDYKELQDYASDISLEDGMNNDDIWAEGYKDSVGIRHEGCGCSPYDDHVLEAILDYDDNPDTDYVSTDLVIAGHDHKNSTIINYKGVCLAYGLKTGGGCTWYEDMSGGTLITFASDGEVNIAHKFYDREQNDLEVRIGLHMPIWSFVALIIVVVISVCLAIIVPILRRQKHKRK